MTVHRPGQNKQQKSDNRSSADGVDSFLWQTALNFRATFQIFISVFSLEHRNKTKVNIFKSNKH